MSLPRPRIVQLSSGSPQKQRNKDFLRTYSDEYFTSGRKTQTTTGSVAQSRL